MTKTHAAIIGCGPSGMVIAHACHQMGMPFDIYAPKQKSFISGAQYLHSDIEVRADGISPRTVSYIYRGVEWQYEKKVYGKLPEGLVTSWSKFKGDVEAWPLIEIYEWLWTQYSERIIDGPVNIEWIRTLTANPERMVFNTAPLSNFFNGGKFWSEEVQIVNGISFAPDDTIVYNGEPSSAWYRSSNLWGHLSVEYPSNVHVPGEIAQYGLKVVKKPLVTAEAIPGVIASGRYGRWEKGVLVDESYHQAIAEIKANT